MKKTRLLALALCTVLSLSACTKKAEDNPPPNPTSGPNTPVVLYTDDSVSKVMTLSGKTLVPYSNLMKGIVTDLSTNEPKYVFTTNYEFLGGDPGDYFNPTEENPQTTLYDLEGNYLMTLPCQGFYTCSGKYYPFISKEESGLKNIETGEMVMEGVVDLQDGGNYLLLMNNYWEIQYITDFDLNVIFDVNGEYSNLYPTTYYQNHPNSTPAFVANKWGGGDSCTLVNEKGENLLDKDFTYLYYNGENYISFGDETTCTVYSLETFEPVYSSKRAVSYYDGEYVVSYDRYREDGNAYPSDNYTLENKEGLLIAQSDWGIYINESRSNPPIFSLSLYDEESCRYYVDLIDATGKTIAKGDRENSSWVSVCGPKGLIATNFYSYDPEKEESIEYCTLITHDGEAVTPRRSYNSASYLYVDEEGNPIYCSYALGYYTFKGNLFTAILDEKGNELVSDIKAVCSNQGKYVIYEKGFDLAIYDLEAQKEIYKEPAFQTLED